MTAGTLLLAAGLAGAAWVAGFVGLLAASTRRRSRAPGPAGDVEVRPAVVNLLVNGAVTRQAVDGTFLDLCARGYLAPVILDDGSWACRSVSGSPDGLALYEQLVLTDTATRLARGPAGRVHPSEVGEGVPGWWESFRRGVADEARARGLVAPRWSRRTRTALLLLAVIPCVLLGAGMEAVLRAHPAETGRPVPPLLISSALAYFLLAVTTSAYAQSPRATATGEAVAAHWLRAVEASPAGVTGVTARRHDRLIAYAASVRARRGRQPPAARISATRRDSSAP